MSTAESSPATVQGMFVGGAWRPSASGETFEATSPGTGEVIGTIPQGDRSDAQAAVAAAAQAFPGWAAQTAFARAAALHRIADVCERRREELARALTLDQASSSPGKRVLLMRRPLGPVAVVTPWNWPYTMPAEIVAPALAAGNTVVWTPAPSTAMCSALLAECVAEADLPPGVFNFVTGPGAVVGDELVANPGTVAVGFIGSTATGRRIAERAAGKRLLLEMGGNGPLVVLDGADVEAAAQAAVSACFLCAGQSCTAGERLLVAEGVRDEFVERLGSAVAADVRLGDPFAPQTTMGPLNNEGVAAKMDEHVGDALTRGARVVAGGARSTDFPTELYWTATILDGVDEDAEVAREETFGPIAPVVPIRGLDHAIELANASPYGLLAAIFTGDVMDGLRFADEVRTGLVNINETTNYWENHLPFGGRAGTDSGIGRIGGRHAVEQLTELQTIVIG